MNARHTPRPWRVEVDVVGRLPMHADLRVVADGTTPDRVRPIARLALQGQETDANARLIAAAPNLLAALEMLVEWVGVRRERDDFDELVPLEEQPREVQHAMRAIAEARGGEA